MQEKQSLIKFVLKNTGHLFVIEVRFEQPLGAENFNRIRRRIAGHAGCPHNCSIPLSCLSLNYVSLCLSFFSTLIGRESLFSWIEFALCTEQVWLRLIKFHLDQWNWELSTRFM